MLAEDFVFQTKKNILCFLYNLKSKIFFLELYLLYEENIENINPLQFTLNYKYLDSICHEIEILNMTKIAQKVIKDGIIFKIKA